MSRLPAIAVTGAPATGKSTLGRVLAGRLGAALLDQDVATGPLVEVVARFVGTDDLDDPRLASATREARYEVITALAEDSLRVGTPVVLVAPFSSERSSPSSWAVLADRLRAAGGDPLMVWLQLDPAEVVRRLQARSAPRDVAKLVDEAAYQATLAVSPPVVPHLALDATRPREHLTEAVLRTLQNSP